ncbi:MAG: hypothetical protein KIT18_01390 [Burkholderiales bacterium]|nr:hypothetical protein [Burkholderiales bacterium]
MGQLTSAFNHMVGQLKEKERVMTPSANTSIRASCRG